MPASRHSFLTAILLVAAVFVLSCAGSPRRYGIVTDQSGRPVEGAVVTITQNVVIPRLVDATSGKLFSAKRTTDADGHYPLPWWVRVQPVGADGKTLVTPLEDDVSIHVHKLGYEYASESGWSSNRVDVTLRRVTQSPEGLPLRPSPKYKVIAPPTMAPGHRTEGD